MHPFSSFRLVLRVLAWLCVALIALLSLIPQQMEARTGLPGSIEHAIAYAGTAALLRLGYPLWPLLCSLLRSLESQILDGEDGFSIPRGQGRGSTTIATLSCKRGCAPTVRTRPSEPLCASLRRADSRYR